MRRDWSIDNRRSGMPAPAGDPWYARRAFTSHPVLKLLVATFLGYVLVGVAVPDLEPQKPQSSVAVSPAARTRPDSPAGAQPKTHRPTPKPAPKPRSAPAPTPEPAPVPQPEPKPVVAPTWPVTEVVDGDTVHVRFQGVDESVRVIGIDTPETVHPTEPVECGGPAASAAAHRLLDGRDVRLVFDPTQGRRDTYGRMLAYVEVPGEGDFGQMMVHQGHAAEYTYDSAYARQVPYLAAQGFAQQHHLGIWARCGGVDTPLHQPQAKAAAPAPAPGPKAPRGGCDPNYRECVPVYTGRDLDCADVDGPIHIIGDDPYGFTADGDAIGCES